MILQTVFRFAAKSIKKHPEPFIAQGESNDPWFHLNLDFRPHSTPLTGLIRRGISSRSSGTPLPSTPFTPRKNITIFPVRQEKSGENMEKGRPFGRPSVWFNQPMLFSFRVRALFL